MSNLPPADDQMLQQSEIRYRRLFEAAHDGILILNSNTRRITDVNPFMLNLLDYPRDHFIGKELWEIGIFKNKAANQRAMQQLHENGSIRFEDLPLEDRGGNCHPVEIVANVYQEGSETVIQCNSPTVNGHWRGAIHDCPANCNAARINRKQSDKVWFKFDGDLGLIPGCLGPALIGLVQFGFVPSIL